MHPLDELISAVYEDDRQLRGHTFKKPVKQGERKKAPDV
jgi:hypothetical protein